MGDDRPCNMEGIDTIFIKMFDGIMRELKDESYVPQLIKKFLSQLVPWKH